MDKNKNKTSPLGDVESPNYITKEEHLEAIERVVKPFVELKMQVNDIEMTL